MARLPEPLPEQDRLQMIRWKQQGLSYDDITSQFAGRYSRGKIVGEITRAGNAGEFQPTHTVNNANNDQPALTGRTPTFVPVLQPATQALRESQLPGAQTPRFLVVNRYPPPVPQPYVYQSASEPTIIFTQRPEKPFDIVEYMLKKAIDGYSARLAAPQASIQTPSTQDQIQRILTLQKQQELEEKQRQENEQQKEPNKKTDGHFAEHKKEIVHGICRNRIPCLEDPGKDGRGREERQPDLCHLGNGGRG